MGDIISFPSKPGIIAAASICVFHANLVLLVKRAKPPFLWSLPGGRIEAGERAEEAALRELSEETGVVATIVGAGMEIDFKTESGELYKISNFAARYVSGEAHAMSDAAEVAWEKPFDLDRYPLTPRALEVIAHARKMVGAG
ncbi:NUDIX domain-containing protein [Tepidamorphus sp. 3E244]|uniref:NUDIX domain-containing protein n=1 Tax=Tepidamorphus sp. 3E244 TaxID=3385498 RepID=UPI0038FD30B1